MDKAKVIAEEADEATTQPLRPGERRIYGIGGAH